MTVAEWQERLESAFVVNGVVGGHLFEVHDREHQVGAHLAKTFRGQLVLIDSFQSFYIETLNLVAGTIVRKGWPAQPSSYSLTLAHFQTLFRRYRACEILFHNGYPLDGYSLFRDVKDRAFLLAGVAHNVTTLARVMGVGVPFDSQDSWQRNGTRARKKEEHRVARRMVGDASGLDPDIVAKLKHWDNLFHLEVHGGMLSTLQEVDLLSKGLSSGVGPSLHDDAFTMYMNRSAELGWMILRLLPYLQMTKNAFGDEWHRKYAVLDDSFRFMADGLAAIGKPIGKAFAVMIDERFTFKTPFHFFEADASA